MTFMVSRSHATSTRWSGLRLRHKLMLSYAALGATITVLSLLAGSYVRGRDEHARVARDLVTSGTMRLASLVASASEEGFSYTVSGDAGERDQFRARLEATRSACARLASAPGMTGPERAALHDVSTAVAEIDAAASTMFEGYERTHAVELGLYTDYETAIDHAHDAVAVLASASRAQSEVAASAVRVASGVMTLGIGALALVLTIALGALMGRRMTMPLVALRDAARAFGQGGLAGPARGGSHDEVGELDDAFEQMTGAVVQRTRDLEASVEELRRSALLLAASEERYRSMFEANAMPMWLWDADTFRFITANDAASQFYGYSRQEFASMTLDALVPESDRPGFRERAGKAITGRFSGERTHITKGGATVRVEIAAKNVMIDGKQCVLTAVRDVTERRGLEAQLLQAQKMEAIGCLAGGIAHDFNNILAVILADADWIAMQLGPDHALLPDAVGIGTAAKRGAALTGQMLAFSRGQPHQPRRVRLNGLVSDTESLLRRLLGAGVQFACSLDPGLGAVEVDPSQIEQVLLNLAINARDAMPSGGALTIVTRNVELGQARHGLPAGAYVAVSVTDTGCGMDAATAARIFEPFFTTKEVGKGTGLGLSTAFGIVRQSAGAIAVESEPGRGSTFTVYLPRCQSSSLAPPEALPVRLPAVGGKTVLVVEDDEQVRRVVCRLLRADGYVVVETRDVAEASGVIDDPTRVVSLVLTDIVMPGTDGVAFAERIRRVRTDTPVLLMSGYTDKVAALEGSRRLLAKPFTPTELSTAVREALEAA